jgi:hypothetical protein
MSEFNLLFVRTPFPPFEQACAAYVGA